MLATTICPVVMATAMADKITLEGITGISPNFANLKIVIPSDY